MQLKKDNDTVCVCVCVCVCVYACVCVRDLPEVSVGVFLLGRVRVMGREGARLLRLLLLRLSHASGPGHTHTEPGQCCPHTPAYER